jgi:hypothetical protein
MNMQELRSQVMRRLAVGRNLGDLQKYEITEVMDILLADFSERDRKAIERKQAPYIFDQRGILWLEREVRAKLKL